MSPQTRRRRAAAGSVGHDTEQEAHAVAAAASKGRKSAAGPAAAGAEEAPHTPCRRGGGKDQGSGVAAVAAAGSADEGTGEGSKQPRSKRQRKEWVVPQPEPWELCFCTAQPAMHVGTSGYSYPHWRQGFYGGLPQNLEFELLSKQFDMVELNATFYGWFKEPQFDAWRDRAAAVRPSFQYVVKAQQLYTHRKRLNTDDAFRESWGRFWACCQHLRPHLGPVLFQFPTNFRTTSGTGPNLTSNIDRLRRLGQVLPAGECFVFEFRDPSWFCPEVYEVLKQHDWCLAITHCTDAPGGRKLAEGGWIGGLTPGPNPPPGQYPVHCCTWGVYVRFRGSEGQYRGAHGASELRQWAGRARAWVASGRQVWFAFNNDTVPPGAALPSAIQDCRDLATALRSNGVWPSL